MPPSWEVFYYILIDMATLTHDDVLRVAQLSGLTLNDQEVEKYLYEFQSILNYFDTLNNYSIDGVEPTYQVSGLKNVTRADKIIDYGVTTEDLLKNAPASQDNLIIVKKVL
jgi:aspartyl-tRNA(Asn)/glutamyl-tRNA(Gln) amidotransferase subunit C